MRFKNWEPPKSTKDGWLLYGTNGFGGPPILWHTPTSTILQAPVVAKRGEDDPYNTHQEGINQIVYRCWAKQSEEVCETSNFCESGVSWRLSTSLALGSSSHPSKPAFCCQGSWWHKAVLQEPARVHNVFSTTLLGWPNPNRELTRCMLKGWLQSAVSLGK